jgi:hypothetical protein
MFETLPNPSLEVVLIAGRALLLLGAFWVFAIAFIRWRRSDEMSCRNLHAHIERTFAEVRSLHETISVMNARLEALSERAELDARLAPVTTGGTQRGYDIATRLARNGADVGEIVANCGITRHEAELLLRLHGAQQKTSTQVAARPATRTEPQSNVRAPSRASNLVPAQSTQNEEEREMLTRTPPPAAGRKRGSLLSVVG